MMCSLSRLDQGKLSEIKAFEKKLGKVVLAWSCGDVKLADLNAERLAELEALQNKLGLVLVATDEPLA
jgi:hypothetical protein